MEYKSNNIVMINISIGDIPEWQQDSQFFDNLIDGSDLDDVFTISSNFIRNDVVVTNIEEFEQVYNIGVYFMIKNIPYSLLDFLLIFKDDDKYQELRGRYYELMSDWWDVFDIVYYNQEKENRESSSLFFAQQGNIKIIEYYSKRDIPISFFHCIESTSSNQKCLEYCLKNSSCTFADKDDEDVFYAHCFENAISKNNLDCIQYLFKIRPNLINYENADEFCHKAAEKGNLLSLIFLHENGFPWDSYTTTVLSQNVSIECLEYAMVNGCPYNVELLYVASPACYKYVVENYPEDFGSGGESDSDSDNYTRPYDERPY
jgi:hypothetical protein